MCRTAARVRVRLDHVGEGLRAEVQRAGFVHVQGMNPRLFITSEAQLGYRQEELGDRRRSPCPRDRLTADFAGDEPGLLLTPAPGQRRGGGRTQIIQF